MASISWLVSRIRKYSKPAQRNEAAPKENRLPAHTTRDTGDLKKAQLAYIKALQRLQALHFDPDLERAASVDLGRAYSDRFGEEEMERLRRHFYGDPDANPEREAIRRLSVDGEPLKSDSPLSEPTELRNKSQVTRPDEGTD